MLEMLVATGLASIVLMGALGLMGFLRLADQNQSRRFDDFSELTILHETIRRAMQTLVAGPPLPDADAGDPLPQTVEEAEERAEAKRKNEEVQERVTGRDRRLNKETRSPRFLLEPLIPNRSGPEDPRRLEVVLLEQPAPGPTPITPTIRGAFELVPDTVGFALVWRSMSPPGEPIALARGLRSLQWSGLAREAVDNRYDRKSGAWRHDVFAAASKEFPKAVRLEIVTIRGTRVDWLFEPAITIGPEP
jgi:hypothetical protein